MKSFQRVAQPLMLAAVVSLVCPTLTMAADGDPDPERFADAIKRFAASDRKSAVPENPVLFVGSSSIVYWQSAEAFPGYPIVNRGFGGSHISDQLYYFDQVVKPYHPSLIVFYCGENDIAGKKTPERVLSDFAKFRALVQDAFGSVPMIYVAIKPNESRWKLWDKMSEVNAAIEKQAAEDETLTYADTASVVLGDNGEPDPTLFKDDRLHLNENGYAKWNAIIEPLLAQKVKKQMSGALKEDKMERLVTSRVTLRYLSYVPEGYNEDAEKQWPLVLFLHGAGERGDDLARVTIHGPTKHVKQGEKYPFILIAPQCPENSWWQSAELIALLNHVEENYRVDPDRIYVTGLSMGGFGTFDLAAQIGDRLAAVAPICGRGNPHLAARFKKLPVWALHGDADPVVPCSGSVDMVEAINAAGGTAKLTLYPGVGHDSWTETYANPEMWKWLLSQKRQP